MGMRKILFVVIVVVFAVIGMKAVKKRNNAKRVTSAETTSVEQHKGSDEKSEISTPVLLDSDTIMIRNEGGAVEEYAPEALQGELGPQGNLVDKLFATGHDKLPIVETVTYKSRVPWLKGRPAWIADYAAHYSTSRHFIARSLNRKADYYTQKVAQGDRFNVFREDVPINFYLLVDVSRFKMWFYYIDIEAGKKVFLKSYDVGLGALKDNKCITPTGQYLLGEKVVTYKPGMYGYFQNEKIEMVRVFGTRWLPYKEEIANCSESAKGYGIHGLPCEVDEVTKEVHEKGDLIGKYDSDGCIRLSKDDIEELYSIIITRPTIVEVVGDAKDLVNDTGRFPEPIAVNQGQ